ncbi:MAG: phosphoribosyl-AMP cyclohydrolase [Candidatus Methylomirabilis sp.]|nr:phosphoribosyl-AMP cyclohydrolase [Deltaproteobacteria bacterium]
MDGDGTKAGYDLGLTRAVSEAVSIPVIASGGVGSPEHILEGFTEGKADAALAASIFHYREYTVGQVKDFLRARGVAVRPDFGGPDALLARLKFDAAGLVTAVVQDAGTGAVLMLAHMNAEALRETVESGVAHYWSRSRAKLWRKGETSGHLQRVREVYVDCDGDAVLLKVDQTGAACHEGYPSCYFSRWEGGAWKVVAERVFDPKAVYGDTKK